MKNKTIMKNKTNGKVFYAIAEDQTSSKLSSKKTLNNDLVLYGEDFLDKDYQTLFDDKQEALDALKDEQMSSVYDDSTKYLVEVKVVKVYKLESKLIETEIK